MKQNPILVTGAHRSGSTFVGKVLSFSGSIGYVHEPFNKSYGINGINNWFLYISKGMVDEQHYEKIINDLIAGRAKYKHVPSNEGSQIYYKKVAKAIFKSRYNLDYQLLKLNPLVKRLLIKDPIACMASEWLHKNKNMHVVVLIRHPAAFVGSLKRLGWQFNFEEFLNQKSLVHNHLEKYLEDKNLSNLSVVEEGCILWNCIYSVLFSYMDRNPKMIGVRHEDVSLNPIEEFRRLYELLEIPYNNRIEKRIRKFTAENNPTDPTKNKTHVLKRNSKENANRWKRVLSNDEIAHIKKETWDLAKRYYPETDW